MGLKAFEIFLDNPEKTYVAGEKVSGFIIIMVTDQVKMVQGITVRLVGSAKTYWKECHGRGGVRIVGDKETHIDKTVVLYGTGDGSGTELELQPGRHEFPFSFQLPSTISASFEHKYGQIRYALTALVSQVAKAPYMTKQPIRVNGFLDLNTIPEASYLCKAGKRKTICCFFCASGPLGFFCKLPKSGFVAGEQIPFTGELYNYSRRQIQVKLSLVQELRFSVNSSYLGAKTKQVTLFTITGPRLEPGDNEIWRPPGLTLPSSMPPTTTKRGIIDIRYYFKLKMEFTNYSEVLRAKLNVYIGTVPVGGQLNFSPATMMFFPHFNRGHNPCPSTPRPHNNAPPTYEQALQCPTSNRSSNNQSNNTVSTNNDNNGKSTEKECDDNEDLPPSYSYVVDRIKHQSQSQIPSLPTVSEAAECYDDEDA